MTLKWLENQPKIKRGVNWGIPWKKGELFPEVVKNKGFLLSGQITQTRTMAYWPDGSIKWTGHSGVFTPESQLGEVAIVAKQTTPDLAVQKFNGIYIENGEMSAFFPKHGEGKNLLDWVKIGGDSKVTDLRLRALYADQTLISQVEKLELEENGPMKAVVKVTGSMYQGTEKLQEFILRFRFYKGVQRLELVHTLIVIKPKPIEGLALDFNTPLVGEDWNRFVKMAGDTQVYSEPAQLLLSRRFSKANQAYALQAAGNVAEVSEDEPLLRQAKENAIWNNFSLTQINHRSFEMKKQTLPGYVNVKIGDGQRSMGLMYAGGRKGGTAISLEKFWEKAPSGIEVSGLTENSTRMTAWLWEPTAGPMDFTHYSPRDHMLSAYEGMEEIRSTAEGIGNTTRLWIDIFTEPANNQNLLALAQENARPAQIVATPEDYHQTQVFGIMSLPDRSHPQKAFLEEQMDHLKDFYLREVERRSWYGYWNYGDVMHTYDPYRHQWRYDFGGYAWQNTELVPNMWLWLDFLRSGDPEIYYFAEAMTRHTSEVDQYHYGEYKGLGSRHNVVHWGCQAKEVRISMAHLHRYYYYLTADERIGEVMEQVKDNEKYAFQELPPMREFFDAKDGLTPIRIGPDWSALVSNWFTQWERTGDQEYLNKILTGINNIKEAPFGLLSGPTFMFDPETCELNYMSTYNSGGYHMVISFGAPQVWMELAYSLNDAKWNELLAEFGWYYGSSPEEKLRASKGVLQQKNFNWPLFGTAMMGYCSKQRQDPHLATTAWKIILDNETSGVPTPVENTLTKVETWEPTEEMGWISTNVVSQWCLNIIYNLELIGDSIPNDEV